MRRNDILLGLLAMAAVAAAILIAHAPSKAPPRMVVVRVGVLPSDTEAKLFERYSPLLAYLSQETGWTFQLVLPNSYENLVQQFADRKVDLANFGGFTFIKAHALHGAVALVTRDVDSRVTTYAVINAAGPLAHCYDLNCRDIRGKRVMFGPELSTSGHLMPRHFLKTEKGIEADTYFSEVRHSTSHRATVRHIRDGNADVGMVHSETFRTMIRKSEIEEGELRVIWETPPFPDNVWAMQADADEQTKTKIRDAFLALDMTNKDHQPALTGLRANNYLPAAATDFQLLMQVAESLDLMKREARP